jgi:hypothetical protein
MVWRAVTDEQWALMKEQLPRGKRRVQGLVSRQMTASAARALSGSYGLAPRGVSYPQGMVRRVPSTAD